MLQLAKDTGEYLELARLMYKYGSAELASSIGLADEGEANADDDTTPDALAKDIEQLGPAYIKLAQIASTRKDLIASEYVEALQRLQDDVEPVAYEAICEIITEELGANPSILFATFDETPLACASLGQVHRAIMRDGREVVVKVQRPDVAEVATNQLASLRRLARTVDEKTEVGKKFRFCALVDAVEYALSLELDYRTEAGNLQRLAENLEEFDAIELPQPVDGLVSRRVLVMDRLTGSSLKEISGVVLNEIDTDTMGNQIVEAYLKQMLVDGLFHADPHPGNLLLTNDHKLGLIDGGMVISVSPKLRRKLGSLLLAVGEREGEEAARISMEIGRTEDGFSVDAYTPAAARVIAQQSGVEQSSLAGETIIKLLNVAGEHGLVMPFELILFSKALLQVEHTVMHLSPGLDIRKAVRSYAGRLLVERASEQASLSKIASNALDSVELASELPKRLNRITELISENALRVSVDAIDEKEFLGGLHKIANRITAGLVTSALIVGASLLMRVDAGPQIAGLPVLATTFFMIAAVVGMYLMWLALVKDA